MAMMPMRWSQAWGKCIAALLTIVGCHGLVRPRRASRAVARRSYVGEARTPCRKRSRRGTLRDSVALAIVALFAASAAAAPPPKVNNAAHWYQQAIERFGKSSPDQINSLKAWDALEPGYRLSAEQRALMVQLEPVFQLMRRGAQQEFSNFGMDFSQGFDLPLPHLNKLRQIGRLMRTDAMVRLQDGDAASAADRLATIYRVAGHMTDDPILISSLVGRSLFMAADEAVQSGFDRAAFNPQDAATLQNAVKALPSNDPFNFVEATAMDQEIMVAIFREWVEHRTDPGEAQAWLRQRVGDNPGAAALAGMTNDDLKADLDRFDQFSNRIVAAMLIADPDQARAEVKTLMDAVENGEFGHLAVIGMPAYQKVIEFKIAAEAIVNARIAQLDELVKGHASPEESANAAVWYLRGIEMIRGMEPAKRATFRALADEPSRELDQPLLDALADARPIIDTFIDGSRKRRCDFVAVTRDGELSLRPHVPGMRQAFALLHADALRCRHEHDAPGMVQLLAACFRTSAHLAGDRSLPASLTAHRAMLLTGQLVPHPLAEPVLSGEQRQELDRAAGAMSRKDPFGYIEAMMAQRDMLKTRVKRLFKLQTETVPHAPGATTRPAEAETASPPIDIERIILDMEPDRMLTLLAVLDGPTPPASDRSSPSQQLFEPLHDVISLTALAAAQSAGDWLRADLAAGRAEPLTDRALDPIAPLKECMTAARDDLRRVVAQVDVRPALPVSSTEPGQ